MCENFLEIHIKGESPGFLGMHIFQIYLILPNCSQRGCTLTSIVVKYHFSLPPHQYLIGHLRYSANLLDHFKRQVAQCFDLHF